MCNLIEFTTGPASYQKYFHELTSGGASFWLKSTGSVVVGLATKPNKERDFELILDQHRCSLESGGEVCSTNDVYDILSSFEFRKFWILWKNNTIVFGSGTTVFLRWKYVVENLIKYVTFCSNTDSGIADWKVYLPPVAITENLPLKRLQGGEPHWVKVEDNFELPDGAMIGGFENEFLYIMRAPFRGSLTPGKFVPSVGLGFIAWRNSPWELERAYECDTVEILCGYNCIWVPSKGNEVPAGAVVGGLTEVHHENMYVGRVNYKGHVIVGYVERSDKCCNFAYEDETMSDYYDFEVLVTPHLNFVPTYC